MGVINMKNLKELKEILIQTREQLNLSISDASRLIGIDELVLASVENGNLDDNLLDSEVLKLICNTYELNYTEIMTLAGWLD